MAQFPQRKRCSGCRGPVGLFRLAAKRLHAGANGSMGRTADDGRLDNSRYNKYYALDEASG
jgi:hypothetical protein